MKPDISVVICSHNGASKIKDTLASLTNQSITNSRYEIIIVNDGSTDGLLSVLNEFEVKVISNTKNVGLAESRNIGLRAAKSEIVAFTDDDCIPNSDWLEKILFHFNQEGDSMLGLSGKVTTAEKKSLAQNYIDATSPLTALPLSLSNSTNFFYRLWIYLKRQFVSSNEVLQHGERISSVVGASMAFRKNDLIALNGFDENFTFGSEEEELCYRFFKVNAQVKDLKYFSDVVLRHKFDPEISKLIRKNYMYGIGNARLRRKYSERSITLYPFPFITIVVVITALLLSWKLMLASLLLPSVLYPSWIMKAFKNFDFKMLVYPYLQTILEMSHNIGWLKQNFNKK